MNTQSSKNKEKTESFLETSLKGINFNENEVKVQKIE